MQHFIRITRITFLLFFVSFLILDNALSTNEYPIPQNNYITQNINLATIPSLLKSETPIHVTIQSDNNDYQGKVYLSSALGKVEPTYIKLVNGKWTGDIIFYEAGKSNYLTILWSGDGKVRAGSDKSALFDVTNSSGYITSDAVLTGKVTSANSHQFLESATVQLFNGDPKNGGQRVYSTITEDDGSYTFKNIAPGIYYQVIEKAGYQKRSEEIAIVSKRAITGDRSLYCACDNKNGLIPILLVPGIMGSHTAGDLAVYPHLPIVPPAWDSGSLALLNPADCLGWNVLKASLTNRGYVEGCTLFDVPYDWSLSILDARDQYLVPWIDRAKLQSGRDKVDIVAHSMGGLLTRSYVQSKNYIGDVRKFAVVGTPNKGSDLAYYLWEGGDPITADNTQPYSIMGQYFYSNTLDYYYIDRHSDQICQFDGPLRPYTPIICDNDKVYDFLHYTVPSTGQLMPVFNSSLIKDGKNVPILWEENTLLKALSSNPVCYNPKGCIDQFGGNYSFIAPQNIFTSVPTIFDGVHTMLFIGITTIPSTKNTIQSIYVEQQPPYYTGRTYKDGIAYVTESNYGDGTVLVDSVHFDEAFQKKLDYSFRSGVHSGLIGTFTSDIVEFITGAKVQVKQQAQPKVLAISIMGRIQPDVISIIDPKGNPINYLADSSVKRVFKADRASLEIENPVDGNYKILLNSPYNEDYELSVLYHDNSNKLFARRYCGYFDGSSKAFSLTVNNDSSDKPISFDRSFDTPGSLKLTNVDNKIQLIWQDNADDTNKDVDHYEIYWKTDTKPYMQLLVKTKQKEYSTEHDWDNATTNSYAVRSVLKNGASTFLSPLAFFIPAGK